MSTAAALCLAWLLCLLPAVASSRPALVLDDAAASLPLTPHLTHLHDPSGELGLDEATQLQRSGRFTPLHTTALGFRDGAYWFHASLLNRRADEPRWLLVQRYALSDHVDVHLRFSDGRVAHYASGDAHPFGARSVPYRHPNFWLELPPDTPVDLYIRVKSTSSMQVPFWLHTPVAFAESSRDAQFGIGIYYGMLLALLFYNLVLWLNLRDATYFWYLLHIGAFGLVLFTLNGLGFEYLWPHSPAFAQLAVPLFISLGQVGMQQFARVFLDLRKRWPAGDRAGAWLIAFFIALAIATFWLPISISTQLASAAVFLSTAWIAVAGTRVALQGYKPARLFVLAWAMLLLGIVMFAAIAFGMLPKTFVTEYGVQIGSALEMLLLSIAIGYRYSALRSDNERIVREAKMHLEHKVELRTTELRQALEQLGDAHARLRETSQRDALTGLHTRGHFRELYEGLLTRARTDGSPLTLLMIDVDHFKRINDDYGHLAGDECLRWTAHCIGQTLRPHAAVPARFGGEEFIVALPGLNAQRAVEVADEVLAKLRARPCPAHGQDVGITASIGVHEVDPEREPRLELALRHADDALYCAKHEGRDRVCVSTPSARPPSDRL
ncbi:sensor domain-containing diguanylate cyclase [Cognatilysobacter bugurensis]|uniref:diguanylate cyclase n=1 Tax=Cognatilysobacter bugurensis TaxID=543356 RepID=A0A918W6H1_9GAMM|nr:diguanylate cyclase [Lysobacter bugurensis]GHA73535.1 sensor domain-containing diguanylate cyclase [Lysobacter bugurensis]